MSLKKFFLTAVLALSSFAATAESISSTVVLTPNPVFPGWYSSNFGATHQFAGAFSDTFSFVPELSGNVQSSIITIEMQANSDIDFSSVSINGIFFTLMDLGNGIEIAQLPVTALQAPLLLTVSGIAGGSLPVNAPIAASYAATFNLGDAYRVPEPATLGLLGLALLGFGAARRRKQ